MEGVYKVRACIIRKAQGLCVSFDLFLLIEDMMIPHIALTLKSRYGWINTNKHQFTHYIYIQYLRIYVYMPFEAHEGISIHLHV